ncbi:hypothetical protein [Spongiactinospora sp. TRM90649]|uniref:hypothetical protein n=1 Tax=Spongiactinospora sp. TRM90649 TaxID=3031114 RepID=UPI0023F981B8|nr:hypothetical protein [Spongiactinospora sp. TRM90649]MDF5758406.1 hypothetical protein [Spongiactinospora sp. TRM90649]
MSDLAGRAKTHKRYAHQLRKQSLTWAEIAEKLHHGYRLNMLAALRIAHGWSQDDAASAWNRKWPDSPTTNKHFSRWENARGTLTVETLGKLAELYECSASALISDWHDYSDLDQYHQDRVVHGTEMGSDHLAKVSQKSSSLPSHESSSRGSGTSLSRGLLDHLTAMTENYRRLDYLSGAQSVQKEAIGHLRRLHNLMGAASTTALHRDLLRATADAAQLSAWLSIDGQDYTAASGYCTIAANLAEQAKDRDMHAYVLGVMSYIHLHAGDGDEALTLLTTATQMTCRSTSPAIRSWLSEATAEAYALSDERLAGVKMLAKAETISDQVTAATTPPYLAFYDRPVHVARLKGRCLMRLGQSGPAIRALKESLDLLPDGYVRERGGTLIDLAYARVQAGQIEEACHVAGRALDLASVTGSQRNLRRLDDLLVVLRPWNGAPCVADLVGRTLLT